MTDKLKIFGPEVLGVDLFQGEPSQVAHVVTMDIKKLSLWQPSVTVGPTHATSEGQSTGRPTPYDFRTNTMAQVNEWVRVIVNLHDQRASFRTDSYFLTAGDRDSRDLLRRGETPTANRIEFFVLRREDPFHVQYNLGILLRPNGASGYELPIYIDPKIENGGGK